MDDLATSGNAEALMFAIAIIVAVIVAAVVAIVVAVVVAKAHRGEAELADILTDTKHEVYLTIMASEVMPTVLIYS